MSIQALLGQVSSNAPLVAYEITERDRVDVNLSSKRNGLPTGTALKQLLQEVCILRVELLDLVTDHHSNLKEYLEVLMDRELKSKNKTDHLSKKELATVIINLFDKLEILGSMATVNQHNTRQKCKTVVQQLIDKGLGVKMKVDEAKCGL